MPPKLPTATNQTQHARKPSSVNTTTDRDHTSAKETGKEKGKEKEKEMDKAKRDAPGTMPPPPPPPKPAAILEPELNALEESLKNTIVTTAQIFKFYADTKRLGVQKHAAHPPRSMTVALEHELGRYDQICDTIDAHLNRAIAVLQRDLEREETRLREEEAERARAKATEMQRADKDVEMANEGGPTGEPDAKPTEVSTAGTASGTGRVPLRRPSKISLSTLQRNPFPLKLDLSSSSLRLGPDEGGLSLAALGDLSGLASLGTMGVDSISGLPSPVTLAPKSARPMGPGELPPEVLAALASASGVGDQNMQMPNPSQQVDIDLTLDDSDLQIPVNMTLENTGNSADKPIELDLDLDVNMSELHSDIFGEQGGDSGQDAGSSTNANVDSLFGPDIAAPTAEAGTNGPATEMDMSILLSENQGQNDALFASLNSGSSGATEGATGNGETGASHSEGGGSELDYSLFFNGSQNQEAIDMMEQFLKMDGSHAGEASEASRSGDNGTGGAAPARPTAK